MKIIDRVRAAAAQLAAESGCDIKVDVERNEGENGFGLYLPDGWNWSATECHTSLNLQPSFTAAARSALADLRAGIHRVDETTGNRVDDKTYRIK